MRPGALFAEKAWEEQMSKDFLDSNLGRKASKYIDRYIIVVLPLHAFPKTYLRIEQEMLTSTELHFPESSSFV